MRCTFASAAAAAAVRTSDRTRVVRITVEFRISVWRVITDQK